VGGGGVPVWCDGCGGLWANGELGHRRGVGFGCCGGGVLGGGSRVPEVGGGGEGGGRRGVFASLFSCGQGAFFFSEELRWGFYFASPPSDRAFSFFTGSLVCPSTFSPTNRLLSTPPRGVPSSFRPPEESCTLF